MRGPLIVSFLCSVLVLPLRSETVTGIIFGEKEITVKAQAQGVLAKISKVEGDAVKSGGLMAVIDDRQETVERELASAEYKTASADYHSTKELGKYVSKEEIRKKKDNYLRKKSNLALKEFNLDNTRVTSPITGVVAKSFFEKGETVSVGDTVYEVVKLEKLKMYIYVPAKDLKKLLEKKIFTFTTPSHGDREFQASIGFVSPVIDSASGTVKIRLDFANIPGEGKEFLLRPGSMAYVKY